MLRLRSERHHPRLQHRPDDTDAAVRFVSDLRRLQLERLDQGQRLVNCPQSGDDFVHQTVMILVSRCHSLCIRMVFAIVRHKEASLTYNYFIQCTLESKLLRHLTSVNLRIRPPSLMCRPYRRWSSPPLACHRV